MLEARVTRARPHRPLPAACDKQFDNQMGNNFVGLLPPAEDCELVPQATAADRALWRSVREHPSLWEWPRPRKSTSTGTQQALLAARDRTPSAPSAGTQYGPDNDARRVRNNNVCCELAHFPILGGHREWDAAHRAPRDACPLQLMSCQGWCSVSSRSQR
jgi:hypothetical protein